MLWDACLEYFCSSSLQIGGQKYAIVKLLGDGGYAFVYLVRQLSSKRLFAMKKIRCMFGGESVANAVREIEACRTLSKTGVVAPCIDSQVVQEEDGSKTVYMVMPYYTNGTLQDRIAERHSANNPFTPNEVYKLGLEIAGGLETLHEFAGAVDSETSETTQIGERERLLDGVELGDRVPYAHRDVKPANIMFDSKNHVVLIDLGSCSPARVTIETRQQAVQLQDLAAEHCTLPFRAPELFDVRTGAQIDERVDVWSYGCTLYAIMYNCTPFEREEQASGGNINLCIARGTFGFPDSPEYPKELKQLVQLCLTVKNRVYISEIKQRLQGLCN